MRQFSQPGRPPSYWLPRRRKRRLNPRLLNLASSEEAAEHLRRITPGAAILRHPVTSLKRLLVIGLALSWRQSCLTRSVPNQKFRFLSWLLGPNTTVLKLLLMYLLTLLRHRDKPSLNRQSIKALVAQAEPGRPAARQHPANHERSSSVA